MAVKFATTLYSGKRLEFKSYGQQCIIAKKLIFSFAFLIFFLYHSFPFREPQQIASGGASKSEEPRGRDSRHQDR